MGAAGRQGLLQKRPAVPHRHIWITALEGDGPVGNSGSFYPARAVPVGPDSGEGRAREGQREAVNWPVVSHRMLWARLLDWLELASNGR